MSVAEKPLGIKAYGSIGHLPNSRLGTGDHSVTDGQARIATIKARDKHDQVWVQEKLDGSCCAVAKINGEIVALGRAGYTAKSSRFEMHHHFDYWVTLNRDRFDSVLQEGERAVGEWLMQAHGTKYDLTGRDPFVLFDLMVGTQRASLEEVNARGQDFTRPFLIASEPTTVEDALRILGEFGQYGALEPVEGAVWRVERLGKVDYLTKFVRHDKQDGCYLDGPPVWNLEPKVLYKGDRP